MFCRIDPDILLSPTKFLKQPASLADHHTYAIILEKNCTSLVCVMPQKSHIIKSRLVLHAFAREITHEKLHYICAYGSYK